MTPVPNRPPQHIARPPVEWERPVEGTRVDIQAYVPKPGASICIPMPRKTFQQRHPVLHYAYWTASMTAGCVLAFFGVMYLLQWMLTVGY